MLKFRHRSAVIKLILVLLVPAATVLFSSCARKMSFGNSVVVPAAQGSVKIKKDGNKNNVLDISVVNLAPPDRLTPPKNVYVVWMETESNGTKNLGQLKSSSGFLSSKLKASLKAVTPFKPANLFITAEDNASVSYPGFQVVMRTNN